MVKEYFHLLKLQLHYNPFKKRPGQWTQGGRDLIFVSGVLGTWIYVEKLLGKLNSFGFRIIIIPQLERGLKSIEQSCKILEDFLITHNIEKVTMIGHSKGGLILKYFLDHSKESPRVDQAYCLCSPFKGTVWGYLTFFNLYEFALNSRIVKTLDNKTENNKKIVSIFPKFDNAILPVGNSYLRGAQNLKLNVIGHTLILDSQELEEVLKQRLHKHKQGSFTV